MQHPSSNTRIWRAVSVAALAAVVGLFFARNIDLGIPFVRVWGLRLAALGFFFFCLGMSFRQQAVKALCFSLLAACAALAVGEGYLAYSADREARERQLSAVPPEFARELREQKELHDDSASAQAWRKNQAYLVSDPDEARAVFAELGIAVPDDAVTPLQAAKIDPDLGYRPATGGKPIMGVRKSGKSVIYSAVYTLMQDGWRTTPQHPEAEEALVFMGDSYTFGEGLNDRDTFPYQVSEALGNRYQVFNFAYSGWGPHQLLRLIETGALDGIAEKYTKTRVFYLSIESHKLRAAGKSAWDQDGPCYAVTADYSVEYKGSFRRCAADEEDSSRLFEQYNETKRMNTLHAAIIRRMAKILAEQYRMPLTVIEITHPEEYLQALRKDGVDFLRVMREGSDEYEIRDDGHPNAAGAKVIARDIVEYVRKNP